MSGPSILRTFFGSSCAHVSSAVLVSWSMTQHDPVYWWKVDDGWCLDSDSGESSSSSSSEQGCRSDVLSEGGDGRWAIFWMEDGVGREGLR